MAQNPQSRQGTGDQAQSKPNTADAFLYIDTKRG
jgi:hypothetical protein